MDYQKMYDQLVHGVLTPEAAAEQLEDNSDQVIRLKELIETGQPLSQAEGESLTALVEILRHLYDTDRSPVNDTTYDTFEEYLVSRGNPRHTSSVEVSTDKSSHKYTNLRGTLDKVYSLTDTARANKSRKSLDEWIRSAEARYKRAVGKEIDLNNCEVMVTCKMDGVSAVEEIVQSSGKHPDYRWLTRGDTANNKATDITRIMKGMNNAHHLADGDDFAVKYEVMITEDDLDTINKYREKPYKNSRQAVVSILNSITPDYRVDFLYPVPLRYMTNGEVVETIHPDLLSVFPSLQCKLSDRGAIERFAQQHHYVIVNGMRFRTDGVVITIMDPKVKRALGREGAINKFEVAYKFTEESAYAKVEDIVFYVSNFGIITPMAYITPVKLKGNTIRHISLGNYGRFKQLDLRRGGMVKVLYDIIPYATIDANCIQGFGPSFTFPDTCPVCHGRVDIKGAAARCANPDCPTKITGKILNYCKTLRIKDIGAATINDLIKYGFLKNGIASLYKLRKAIKRGLLVLVPGLGERKLHKMLKEIEAKRKLNDWELFGALGIEGLSTSTFRKIFGVIPGSTFISHIRKGTLDRLNDQLVSIPGIGDAKATLIEEYFSVPSNVKALKELLKEVEVMDSVDGEHYREIVFSGMRPDEAMTEYLNSIGYMPIDRWKNSAEYLVVPSRDYNSTKVKRAVNAGVPIVYAKTLKDLRRLIK